MHDYPALIDLATQQAYPLGVSESFVVGRNETADVCVLDPTCSRHHFRLVRRQNNYFVERLNAHNPTYLDGKPVATAEPLRHGSVLQAGQARFRFLLGPAASEETIPRPRTAPPRSPLLPAGDESHEIKPFPLAATTVIGRDPNRAQLLLLHPQVSRVHASLVLQRDGAVITDLGSANGTFVNGRGIRRATRLQPGDELDVGPYALLFTGRELKPRTRSDNVELVAEGIRRIVRDRETGKQLALLDDVSLVIRPREFVCLLGPSGSGKSTLLSILSGRTNPDDGAVLLNGRDLHANFEAIKQDVAVVPQKDVLHDSLAVGQALGYTARLRLPSDTSRAEINTAVTEMLDTVGLTARRGTLIRHLSGGQVKRASLANEILCKPTLIFLDEVTSGLDEQTDREVMNLFRSLADAGKTVVCITHSLANVERTCHLVVILTAGGKLAFVGKPAEAMKYFDVERLGDVYDRLKEQPAEVWQKRFKSDPCWKRYVVERLPPEGVKRGQVVLERSEPLLRRMWLMFRQTVLLTSRYAAIWRGDFGSLLAMMGQALLVAVLLGLVFGDLSSKEADADEQKTLADQAKERNDLKKYQEALTERAKLLAEHATRSVNLLFLLAVSSYWFGCNNAAKEIVKERTIYVRERDFNLFVGSYYASKLLLLSVCSAVQVLLLFGVVRAWCRPPDPWQDQLAVLLVLSLAGVALGLAISTLATTEEMAITMIPMAVIPQIILSGAIVPLEGLSEMLALGVVSTYWGKRGLDGTLPEKVVDAIPGGMDQHSTVVAVLVLLAHALACVLGALVVLQWQSKGMRTLNALMSRRKK